MKLPFPEAVLNQHLFAGGKTGAGKSYMLRILIEWLLYKKRRVCILDPKGDHYGIISSTDGKGPGYPVVLFGDHKVKLRDSIPINPRAGKEVAELVATGNRPCVIGFRGWMPSDRTRFYIDFASTLFNKNHAPLWLVEDEIHNFAPQGKVMDPDAGKCLHWANRLSSEGRGNGIVLLMASQRPQKVHKDTVTCAETLIAMRVVHNLDRAAMKEWMDGAGDPERSRLVLNSLAEMQRGEAFVWSPEIKFFDRIQFSKITTFDSFGAPSGTGEQQDLKGWAEVDLDEVKLKLASTIEEAKANDPAELKKRIRELENKKKVAVKESPIAPQFKMAHKTVKRALEDAMKFIVEITTRNFDSTVPKEQVEKAVNEGVERAMKLIEVSANKRSEEFERFKQQAQKLLNHMQKVLGDDVNVKVDVRHNEPFSVSSQPERLHRNPILPTNGNLAGTQQRILDTAATLHERGIDRTREGIARWLGIHPNGGRYLSDIAALRAQGYMPDRGYDLTEAGHAVANVEETGIDATLRAVEGTRRKILETVIKADRAFSREDLAAELGIHPNGGRFLSDLSWLRQMGVIPDRGAIELTEGAKR